MAHGCVHGGDISQLTRRADLSPQSEGDAIPFSVQTPDGSVIVDAADGNTAISLVPGGYAARRADVPARRPSIRPDAFGGMEPRDGLSGTPDRSAKAQKRRREARQQAEAMERRARVRGEEAKERKAMRDGERLARAMEAAEALPTGNAERPVVDPASIYLIHVPNSSTSDPVETEYDLLPERMSRAAYGKQRANFMAEYLWDRYPVVAQKIASCNVLRIFRHWLETGDCRLVHAFCCKQDKLCPVCGHLRSIRNASRYMNKILQVVAQTFGLRDWMWTFTIKDGPDLIERIAHLRKALRLLVDHRRKFRNSRGGRNTWMPFCCVAGGVYSVEITIGRNSGQWHVHAHVYTLCDYDPPVVGTRCEDMESWWHERTGDSFVVDVRPISQGERFDAALEVLKYAAKFSAMTLSQNVEAWKATTGANRCRLMQGFGCLQGVKECDVLTDELSRDEGPYIEEYYRFDGRDYELVKTSGVLGAEAMEVPI